MSRAHTHTILIYIILKSVGTFHRILYKCVSIYNIGVLTYLLQNMFSVSTIDTDANTQTFLVVKKKRVKCLCYDLTAVLLKILDIAYFHSIRFGFQMAPHINIDNCEIRRSWWPIHWYSLSIRLRIYSVSLLSTTTKRIRTVNCA
jgi:hypothetical protein